MAALASAEPVPFLAPAVSLQRVDLAHDPRQESRAGVDARAREPDETPVLDGRGHLRQHGLA